MKEETNKFNVSYDTEGVDKWKKWEYNTVWWNDFFHKIVGFDKTRDKSVDED